jgi:type II secretory ATPase GspE/PulE/Tfp pilus assembly ATPase PilB-like protein
MSTGSETPTPMGVAGDLLEHIIADAIDEGASEIDLEPQDGALRIRFRVDGVSRDIALMAAEVAPALLNRLRASVGLEISDRVLSREGRALVIIEGRPVDLRIAISRLGERRERVAIRIFDASPATLGLERVGLDDAERNRLEQILAGSKGLVLVAGPKESGKTTTLYAALRQTQRYATSVVTVEDRLEYRLDGVKQVQLNDESRLSLASALRLISRQNPDVVLVSEIRDFETVESAIRASVTGHMILSTIQAVDSVSAIAQLIDMGADPRALSVALRAVIAQRLVRRLCPECSVPMPASKVPSRMTWSFEGRDTSRVRAPVGCAACRGSGYRGRMAVAELLVVEGEIQQLMSRATHDLYRSGTAPSSGMKTLWERGVEHVLAGLTSIDELVANLSPSEGETGLRSGRTLSLCG